MEKNKLIKWIEELEKAEVEQINSFNKYQAESMECIELYDFFEKVKNQFMQEIEKEKIRVIELLEKNKNIQI